MKVAGIVGSVAEAFKVPTDQDSERVPGKWGNKSCEKKFKSRQIAHVKINLSF
jgi:hypothetical protein